MSYRNDKIYYTTTKTHCRSASQITTGAAQITSLLAAPVVLWEVHRCTAPTAPAKGA